MGCYPNSSPSRMNICSSSRPPLPPRPFPCKAHSTAFFSLPPILQPPVLLFPTAAQERAHRPKSFNGSGLHNPMGTRRPCARAAPSTDGADKNAQRQNANVVSGVLSGPCAIHMGPPPDQHRTASRLPPYRLDCCMTPGKQLVLSNLRAVSGRVGWRTGARARRFNQTSRFLAGISPSFSLLTVGMLNP